MWTRDRIRRLRKQHDETQAEFCQRLGVTVHALRYWEQGQSEPPRPVELLLDRIEEDLKIGKPRELQAS